MRIVLLGPPGSGKGTQAKRVAAHYQVPHVAVAGALADIAAEDSELGRLVKETVETNRVSDDLIIAVLRVRLTQPDAAKGFVLDGFPRTATQAETLETVLDGVGRPLDVVLLVDVDPDELMERLVGRLTCEGCGAVYNVYANPPTVEGVCDRCGGRVSRRPDDYEETISNRLRIFESQTAQVIEHFKLHGKLRRVSGEGGSDEVFEQIRRIIDATPRTVIEMEPVAEAAELLPAALPGLAGTPVRPKAAKASAKAAARPAAGAKASAAATVAAFKQVAAEVAAEKSAAKKGSARSAAPAKPPAKAAGKPAAPAKAAAPVKSDKGPTRPAASPVAAKKAEKPAAAPAKSAPKKAAGKPAEKKAAGKKPAVKPVAKKAAAKKAAPKEAAPKKTAPKKAAPKKSATKKAAAKKPVPKKAAPKKPAPKKAMPKASAKKPVPKKAPAKKKPVRRR